MLPCPPGSHRRSFVGVSAHTPDRYTELWPACVHSDTPTCVGSARAIPTSARAAGAHVMSNAVNQQSASKRLSTGDHAVVLPHIAGQRQQLSCQCMKIFLALHHIQ